MANAAGPLSLRSNSSRNVKNIIAAAWSNANRAPVSERAFGTSIRLAKINKGVLLGQHKVSDKEAAKEPAEHTKFTKSLLAEFEYNKLATETLDNLALCFDDIGEELAIDDFDVEYANGVLTVTLGEHGTYVLNKQPPNKQIWLSSPISGPERFDYDLDAQAWFCQHTHETLGTLLSREMTRIFAGQFVMPLN
ncbi:Mitochondrial matrix iron chaperone [Coemansia sp. RSA 1933]|nr:Mitochondrial matrix iron chaperone [Coemansia sp. RSA 1933]